MGKKEKLKNLIISEVEKENYLEINKITSGNYGTKTDHKNGIYFLYDKDKNIIYIGKIGNGNQTSLYSRLKGHGSGAHDKEYWWIDVATCKFKKFADLTNKELNQIERLAINKKTPKYNDVKINDEESKVIINKISPKSNKLK